METVKAAGGAGLEGDQGLPGVQVQVKMCLSSEDGGWAVTHRAWNLGESMGYRPNVMG